MERLVRLEVPHGLESTVTSLAYSVLIIMDLSSDFSIVPADGHHS